MENKNGRTPEFQLLILIGVGIVARGVWVLYVWLKSFVQLKTHLYGMLLIGALALALLARHGLRKLAVKRKTREKDKAILAPEHGAVYCGRDDHGEEVFVKTRQRSMHKRSCSYLTREEPKPCGSSLIGFLT
jgi:hypothetical protein